MSETKIYELKANPGEMQLWHDAEMRKMIIQGGIEQAKDQGCRILRVLDTDGGHLHLEAFGPRLWDMIARVHDGLDELLEETQRETRAIHLLVKEALDAHDRGDTKSCHVAIKAAMDKEHATFGDVNNTGDDTLLAALGYDIEQEEPV